MTSSRTVDILLTNLKRRSVSIGTHTITASITDSGGQTTSSSVSITISDLPPVVAIVSPVTGSSYSEGETVTLSGTAWDYSNYLSWYIEWSSSIDGSLGTGASLNRIMSVGTHTVTASVTDYYGQTSASSVTITVTVAGFIDSDSDSIDDNWEKLYAPGGDLNYFGAGDKEGDGYSDFEEYLNRLLIDSAGNIYDPGVINEPDGPGYAPPGSNTAFLSAIYFLLLKN